MEADAPSIAETSPQPNVVTDEEFAEEEIFAEPQAEKESGPEITTPENNAETEITLENAEEKNEAATEVTEENLSSLVNQLNLTDTQLDAVKFLSDESRMRQEQLEKSVELLKTQAHDIEAQTLQEFLEILTPEQKQIFEKIQQINSAE